MDKTISRRKEICRLIDKQTDRQRNKQAGRQTGISINKENKKAKG